MSSDPKNKKSSILAQWRNRKKDVSPAFTIPLKPKEEIARPSSGQHRLWLLQKLYPENPFYQYAHLYTIKGTLDIDLLKDSFQFLIDKHAILRTNFLETEEGVILKINPTEKLNFDFTDLSDLKVETAQQQAQKTIQTHALKTFNLEKDSLVRLHLLKITKDQFLLALSIHHIIGDRSSLLLMNQEWLRYYKTIKENKDIPSFDKNSIQYVDYAHWKNQQATKEKDIQYWQQKLSGPLATLALPTDFQRPKEFKFKGSTIRQLLSPTVSQQLKQLAKDQQTTMYVVLLSAFKTLLFRYTHQEDIIVGCPFSTRDQKSLEQLIGFFNETLVLRTRLSDQLKFSDSIAAVKETSIQALTHKNVGFDELVKRIKPGRKGTTNPLFQIMFVYNEVANRQALEGLSITEETIDLGVSKFDLTLFATDQEDTIELALEFSTELFELETAARILDHLSDLLTSIAGDPAQQISQISFLGAQEKSKLLTEWNNTSVKIPSYDSIHQLFEEKATHQPNKIAVACNGEKISYGELNQKANRLAQKLLTSGVKPNEFVGLFTGRSMAMVIGILGILKSGAAYLPLDPKYPTKRIEFMVDDAKINTILYQKKWEKEVPLTVAFSHSIEDAIIEKKQVDITLPTISKDQLAYIIYTSGSSGIPKGVAISHQNLIHSTAARFYFFEQNPTAFLLLSSFSFDSSVAGIFWTLCTGGTLVLPPARIEQDMRALAQIIFDHKVSHTLLLPSLYKLLLDNNSTSAQLASLQTVMVAGEACSSATVLAHFKKTNNVELVNEYGPTEGTVWSTAYHITPKDAFANIPIGRPIPNTQHYILDKNEALLPIGIPGELHIAGAGIANGYWQRPELTAKRFISKSFVSSTSDKLYKTGDLVRYRKDGIIEFLGRIDQQVKIRGHRIELDEIKNHLLHLASVEDALAIIQNRDTVPRLVAYIIPTNKEEAVSFKEALTERLPNYMIPSAFINLTEFPTLPNGKIDYSALPIPTKNDFIPDHAFVAAKTEIQKQLTAIWESILQLTPIGIHDNFFAIGGDSIRSIQIISKAQEQGIEIAPHHIFEYQTIYKLGTFLENVNQSNEENTNWASLVPLKKEGTRRSLFCIHSGGAHVFFYQGLAKYIEADQPLYALQPSGLNNENHLHSSIEEMASYYISEMQKLQPHGPYYILGTCFSNAVGLEMANQLALAGESIARLIIVDSGPQYLLGAAERGGKKTTRRFVKMVKEKNWSGIRKKLRNRFIRTKQKALAPLENEQEKNLRLTINSLNQLYHNYTWKPFNGKVTFIRSTEFANRTDKNSHLTQWHKLAKGGLEVHIVEGHHKTLFEEPEVQGLAQQINACLMDENIK